MQCKTCNVMKVIFLYYYQRSLKYELCVLEFETINIKNLYYK